MRVRIRFEKTGIMRYVGHLDLMRFFQKAVKRSMIPIKYSEGYNPHQIMSFASPLGVGLTSNGEYMDIDIKEDFPSKEGIDILNKNMVEGLNILSFKYLPDDALKCMSAVTAASYTVTYKNSDDEIKYIENLSDLKSKFYDEADSINIVKETKKGTRELDLKPLLLKFELDTSNELPVYNMLVSSGSTNNIKPELVIKAFHEFIGIDHFDDLSLDINRNDMYTGEFDSLVSLGDIGDEH